MARWFMSVVDFKVQFVFTTLTKGCRNRALVFLEMFKSSSYRDLALSEWLTHTPPELVMAHLRIDKATLDALPKEEVVVMPK